MHTKEKRKKNQEQREKNVFKLEYIFILFSFFYALSANAQCAMCRAALTNDANVEQAKAVNDGIVYLMVIPYLLVALVGYFVYKMRKSKSKTE